MPMEKLKKFAISSVIRLVHCSCWEYIYFTMSFLDTLFGKRQRDEDELPLSIGKLMWPDLNLERSAKIACNLNAHWDVMLDFQTLSEMHYLSTYV